MEPETEQARIDGQTVADRITLALEGDSAGGKYAAKVLARWNGELSAEEEAEEDKLSWYGRMVDEFFRRLREMCL